MDWQTIILALISGGAVSAAITTWAQRSQTKALARKALVEAEATEAEIADKVAATKALARKTFVEAEATEAEIADKVAAVYERTIKHLEGRVASLEAVQARLESTETELTTRTRENIELRQRVQELSAEVVSLRQAVEARDRQIAELVARVKALEKRGTEPLKGID